MPTNSNASLRYCILIGALVTPITNILIDDLLDTVDKKIEDKEGYSIGIRELYKDIQDTRDH